MENVPLVRNVLHDFSKAGILDNIILIGSWCLYFYKNCFHEFATISTLRTTDIDFLVPKYRQIKSEYNIPQILKKHDFKEVIYANGLIKFENPELKLEFLVNEIGKGTDKPVEISKLNINAIALRFLNILQENTVIIDFEGMKLTLPEPAAYSLQKLLIYQMENKAR